MRYVYLAGPITGLEFGEAVDWRDYVEDDLFTHSVHGDTEPWLAFSPLHGKEEVAEAYEGLPLPDSFEGDESVADEDFDYIDRCDAVLANFSGAQRVSIGTCVELGYAFARDKRIITVIPERATIHDHLFIRRVSSIIVPTLKDALAELYSMEVATNGTQ